MFENGGLPVVLHPDITPTAWDVPGGAPLMVTGPEVEAIIARAVIHARLREQPCRVGGSTRLGQPLGMTASPNPYRGFRFPADIVEQPVWLFRVGRLLRAENSARRDPTRCGGRLTKPPTECQHYSR